MKSISSGDNTKRQCKYMELLVWPKMQRFLRGLGLLPAMEASFAAEHAWLQSFVPKLNERLREKLVAHRGFHCPKLSDLRPLECTLPALQMAWQSGLVNCECDVRLSSDEQIILLHDPNLDRLVEESVRPTPNANTLLAEELSRWPLRQRDIHIPLLQDTLESALTSGSRLETC